MVGGHSDYVKGTYLNYLKFTGCLNFQLHFLNYISKKIIYEEC